MLVYICRCLFYLTTCKLYDIGMNMENGKVRKLIH